MRRKAQWPERWHKASKLLCCFLFLSSPQFYSDSDSFDIFRSKICIHIALQPLSNDAGVQLLPLLPEHQSIQRIARPIPVPPHGLVFDRRSVRLLRHVRRQHCYEMWSRQAQGLWTDGKVAGMRKGMVVARWRCL